MTCGWPSGVEHDVRRLQVAVDDAEPVGGVERLGDLRDEPRGPVRIERPGPEPVGERHAADEFLDEVADAVLGPAGLVERDDAGVLELRGAAGLAEEPLASSAPASRPARRILTATSRSSSVSNARNTVPNEPLPSSSSSSNLPTRRGSSPDAHSPVGSEPRRMRDGQELRRNVRLLRNRRAAQGGDERVGRIVEALQGRTRTCGTARRAPRSGRTRARRGRRRRSGQFLAARTARRTHGEVPGVRVLRTDRRHSNAARLHAGFSWTLPTRSRHTDTRTAYPARHRLARLGIAVRQP